MSGGGMGGGGFGGQQYGGGGYGGFNKGGSSFGNWQLGGMPYGGMQLGPTRPYGVNPYSGIPNTSWNGTPPTNPWTPAQPTNPTTPNGDGNGSGTVPPTGISFPGQPPMVNNTGGATPLANPNTMNKPGILPQPQTGGVFSVNQTPVKQPQTGGISPIPTTPALPTPTLTKPDPRTGGGGPNILPGMDPPRPDPRTPSGPNILPAMEPQTGGGSPIPTKPVPTLTGGTKPPPQIGPQFPMSEGAVTGGNTKQPPQIGPQFPISEGLLGNGTPQTGGNLTVNQAPLKPQMNTQFNMSGGSTLAPPASNAGNFAGMGGGPGPSTSQGQSFGGPMVNQRWAAFENNKAQQPYKDPFAGSLLYSNNVNQFQQQNPMPFSPNKPQNQPQQFQPQQQFQNQQQAPDGYYRAPNGQLLLGSGPNAYGGQGTGAPYDPRTANYQPGAGWQTMLRQYAQQDGASNPNQYIQDRGMSPMWGGQQQSWEPYRPQANSLSQLLGMFRGY